MRRLHIWLERSLDRMLGGALFLLPITSLPLLSRWLGGAMVAPPAALLVMAAGLCWGLLLLLRRDPLPRETQPFLFFLLAAAVSALLALFLPVPTFRDHSVARSTLEGVLTLLVGAAFYLLFASAVRDNRRMETLLRILNFSGILFLGWGLLQLVMIRFNDNHYPAWMIEMHSWISIRSLQENALRQRVTAMAFEPSWLAHQLNVLYLPYWLGASLQGYSAFPRRLWKVSLENILLAAGFLVLFFSLSRIGLLAFLLVLAYLGLHLNVRLLRWLGARPLLRRFASRLAGRVVLQIGLLLVYALAAAAFVMLVAHFDPRVALIFNTPLSDDFLQLATQLGFSERVVFWLVGWNVFARYPLFGVGPGNLGFFFPQEMPAFGYRLYEVLHIFAEEIALPNAKSLWTRLLGETGLIGFSLFLVWLYVQWRAARFAASTRSALLRALGWMGQFALVAFLIEGFSVDSFVLPYLWTALGLVSAAGYLTRHSPPAEIA